jgi:hypothetical protein
MLRRVFGIQIGLPRPCRSPHRHYAESGTMRSSSGGARVCLPWRLVNRRQPIIFARHCFGKTLRHLAAASKRQQTGRPLRLASSCLTEARH